MPYILKNTYFNKNLTFKGVLITLPIADIYQEVQKGCFFLTEVNEMHVFYAI